MIKRVLSAAVLVPLLVWLVLFANPLYFAMFIFIVSILAYAEWLNMDDTGFSTEKTIYLASGALFVYMLLFYRILSFYTLIFIFMIHLVQGFSSTQKEKVLKQHYYFSGILYISLYSFMYMLVELKGARILLMLMLVSIWVGDSFAYFCGRVFGKHKLAVSISPGKTVEGAVCGVFTGVVAAIIFGSVFKINTALSIEIGLIANITGIFGDLSESVIKRAFNKKDSSNLIPGHGGVLDRLDSVAFASFFVYILVLWKML